MFINEIQELIKHNAGIIRGDLGKILIFSLQYYQI